MGLSPFREGIEFPNPDFASLARACGGGGFAARKPDELQEAINEAFALNGPAIVDAVVVADELPNLPHVDLDVIGHYAPEQFSARLNGLAINPPCGYARSTAWSAIVYPQLC
jgi:hypothetical protein